LPTTVAFDPVADWDRYRIRTGEEVEIETVRHIAHVPTAKRIIEDGQIKSGLIYDQSLLNRSRISVVWLSANTWAHGSMYGTVAFEFPWSDIVEDQNIYWVEAITQYNPAAFRFLLSKRDLASPHLQRYDPRRDNGPLRLRDGKWFRAGNLTSEFMVEEDVKIDRSATLDFVSHHPRYCSLNSGACEDIGRQPSPQKTAARMLAHVLAQGQHGIDELWKPPHMLQALTPLEIGYSGLWLDLTNSKTTFGGALQRPESCGSALMGVLALYSLNQVSEARSLLSLMKSEAHFERAMLKAVRRHFQDARWKPDW
jgi:hypothetical protein